jgi:hypothetical protein
VIRCVAYDFNGEFEYQNFNHPDEEREERPNIKKYYESDD